MIKLIILVLGIAGGFGGGIYWAHHNPDAAAKISAEEEKRFIAAQLSLTQKLKAKLEQLDSSKSGKTPGSGFVAGGSASASQADVKDLKSDTDKLEQDLQKRLAELK